MLNDVHPADGQLFQHFDEKECDRRLGVMASVGLNCLRQAIGVNEVFDPATGLKAQGMKNWDTFITLAEKHGVYLMPVGGYIGSNDWFDAALLADSGKSLDESCAFWSAFCGHYKDHPAIWAWDLRNELLYSATAHMVSKLQHDSNAIEVMLKEQWPLWLETKYGSLEAMNRAYASQYKSFSQVPGSISFIEKPFDVCAGDFRIYLNERGYRWCKRQCDIIRAVAPNQMIVSGNNTWITPDSDLLLANGFHNYFNHDLFDFVTFHPYPACPAAPGERGDPLDDLDGEVMHYWTHSCLANARMEHYGKPVVVQEFGWYGGGESRFLGPLPYRSEEEHAEYTRRFTDALFPHVNGFINWPTFDMPDTNDTSNHGGIFTRDGKPKALARVYEDLVRKTQGRRLVRPQSTSLMTFSHLGIYTSRAYQNSLWDQVHDAFSRGEIPDFRFV